MQLSESHAILVRVVGVLMCYICRCLFFFKPFCLCVVARVCVGGGYVGACVGVCVALPLCVHVLCVWCGTTSHSLTH